MDEPARVTVDPESFTDALFTKLPWGNPLDRARQVTTLGQVLEATRRNRLMVAGLLAFAVVLVGMTATMLVRGALDGTLMAILSVVFLGTAALIGWWTRRRARDFVAVFEGGVAFDERGALKLVPWSAVVALDQKVADLVDGMTRRPHDVYTLRLADGSRVTWNFEYERHRHVGQRCAAQLELVQSQANASESSFAGVVAG